MFNKKLFAHLLMIGCLSGVSLSSGLADDHPYVEGEILVKYTPGTNSEEIEIIRRQLNAIAIKSFSINQVHYYRLPTTASVEETIAGLNASGKVIYAEPNYLVSALLTPNDPKYNLEWGLNNSGQSGGTVDADIDALEAWDIETGDPNLIVAVIDTGVDYTHPDLIDNIWVNENEIPGNGIDDDNNGFIDDVHGYDFINDDGDPFDDHGHGTHVSGTIGAMSNNGIGVAGVVWNTKIMCLKFLSSGGSGSIADAVTAVDYAVANGAKIMSNSWGGGGFSQAMSDAITAADSAGVLFIAAAGNSANNNDNGAFYPSNYENPNVIAVAATDHKDALASFSSYGATTVDLGAPGVNVYSTVPDDSCSLCDVSGYRYLSGTSMATPHVSGAAALIWSHEPGLTHLQVKQRLLGTADPIPSLSGKTLSEGRLNLNNMMEEDIIPPAPITDLVADEAGIFHVTLSFTASGDDGLSGKASAYDVRYATSSITEETWASAVQATGEPKPKDQGELESVKVKGLSAQTTYYFAVKVRDNIGNESTLSNVVSISTNVGVTIYEENFENGGGSWVINGDDGNLNGSLWHLSTNRNSSPNTSFYYGIEGDFDYDTGKVNYGEIISPLIDLSNTQAPTLRFDQFLETEDYSPYDVAKVSITINNGLNWITLHSQTSTSYKWETVDLDLSVYAGQSVQIKFSFNTLDSIYNSYEGWYVDQIRVIAMGNANVTPPAPVSDLAVAESTNHAATLGWTAVGSDGSTGTATFYDLRYSTSSLSEANFDSAVKVPGEPFPQEAGNLESMIVGGLDVNTTYYFALKVGDNTGLVSDLSNVVSITTKTGPQITINPQTLPAVQLVEGATTAQTLQISNFGDMDLNVELFKKLVENEVNVKDPMPLDQREENVNYVARQVIVKLKESVSSESLLSIHSDLGTRTLSVIPQANLVLVELPEGSDASEMMGVLSEYENIEYAEPNYIVSTTEVIPNDTNFASLYGLHNTGQFNSGKPDADIDAPEAWVKRKTSPNVIVAVIDTGVDYTHPDLAANIWNNQDEICGNGIDDDNNGFIDDCRGWDYVNNDNDPMDDHSHGTHVSGTVGAVGNNNMGVVGVTWDVQIMPLKFLSAGGSGSIFNGMQCVYYAINNGAHVMSNSWGGGGFSQSFSDAIDAAAQAGIIFVAAVGNSASNNDASPHYPSSYPQDNVVAVAATDYNDNLAYFSSYGLTSVDIAAPGVTILSTVPGNKYSYFSGTSMATPHVAGVLALVKAQFPQLGYKDLINQIMFTTDTLAALQGKMVSGGRVNLDKALGPLETNPPAAVGDLAVQEQTFSVTLEWTATGDDGLSGQADSYDIRYSLSIINEGNFNSAVSVPYAKKPLLPGQQEKLKISGLDAQTQYYFALKVNDDSGNESPISNVVVVTTKEAVIVFQDDMEANNGFWSGTGFWHRSTRKANSGSYALWYGQESNGSYYSPGLPNSGIVTSNPIALPVGNNLTFKFKYWRRVENNSYGSYDKTYLQVSDDEGQTWETLWFKDSKTPSLLTWKNSVPIDISAFDGKTVQFRFVFQTVTASSNYYEGFFVDDIMILDQKNSTEWLQASPSTFVIAPGDSASSTLTYDSTGLVPGPYTGTLSVTSNASLNSLNLDLALQVVTDATSPDPITQFVIVNSDLNSIYLQWIATGDDGSTGTASSYDLGYSTEPLTEENFQNATKVQGLPSPQPVGATENVTLSNLEQGTTYYFGLKACDEVNNCSTLVTVSGLTEKDSDNDGLSDAEEGSIGTDPFNSDTDADGLSDGDEVNKYSTDPLKLDTDGDGYNDGDELLLHGSDPNDSASFGYTLYKENFNTGQNLGDLNHNWSMSGKTDNVAFAINEKSLVASVTGSDYGYTNVAPLGKDFSALTKLALTYDVTFTEGASWGGLWLFGAHVDINVYRYGARVQDYKFVPSSIKRDKKYHILVEVEKVGLDYEFVIYVNGRRATEKLLIKKGELRNNTIGFVSPYYSGKMIIDNFSVWPKPLVTPYLEEFKEDGLGTWILAGNPKVKWNIRDGALKSIPTLYGSGYGFAKHALLDVADKNMIAKFKIGHYRGARWGGFLYRNILIDFNPNRKNGWRDDSYTYLNQGLVSDREHEVVVIVKQDPSLMATVYVDKKLVVEDHLIEKSEFTSDTVGFASNYFKGVVFFDDFYIQAQDIGKNMAPVFLGLRNKRILVNEPLTYQLQAVDTEDDALTYSSPDIGSLPGATLSADGLLSWTPVENDAGTYTLTVEVNDGVDTTTDKMLIVVDTSGSNALIYEEDFDQGLDSGDNWQETDNNNNVAWSLVEGKLESRVTASGGYSYYAPFGQDFSGYTSLVIQYDVTYKDEAKWGGLWFRGVYIDINRHRYGMRDNKHNFVNSTIEKERKYHVIAFIREVNGLYESDIYINGKPVLLNEPFDVSNFTNNTIGFVSPYLKGAVLFDDFKIYDFSVLSETPVAQLFLYDDYSSDDFDGWVSSGATSNTDWAIINKSLVVTKLSQGGYSFIRPFDLNVKDKNINIEYDVTFKDGARWGGLYYRGIYFDVNLNRLGSRDDSYTFINSPMVNDKKHHIQVTIRQNLTFDIQIDGTYYVTNETIDSSNFGNNSVGFVSNYFGGTVIYDHLKVEEI